MLEFVDMLRLYYVFEKGFTHTVLNADEITEAKIPNQLCNFNESHISILITFAKLQNYIHHHKL